MNRRHLADGMELPGGVVEGGVHGAHGLDRDRLAKQIGVPAHRIGDIVRGKHPFIADTDLRLRRFVGLSDGYLLRAQAAYDIEVARRELVPELTKITPWTDTST